MRFTTGTSGQHLDPYTALGLPPGATIDLSHSPEQSLDSHSRETDEGAEDSTGRDSPHTIATASSESGVTGITYHFPTGAEPIERPGLELEPQAAKQEVAHGPEVSAVASLGGERPSE